MLKKKKLFKKKLKEVEATKKLSPLERIRASIKGNSPSVGILNDDILPNVSKLIKDSLNTRHTMANIAHTKTHSIDDVMNVTRKQNLSELNWQRKVNLTLNDDDDDNKTTKSKSSNTTGIDTNNSNSNNTNKSSYSNSYSQNLTDEESERRDKKILNKKKFGPYKVQELLRFLRCFQTVPTEIKDDASTEYSLMDERSMLHSGESNDDSEGLGNHGLIGRMNHYNNSNGYDDDDDDDDWPTDDEDIEERKRKQLEEEEAANITPESIAEKERLEEEAKQLQVLQLEREAEMKHAIDVVTTNVRLLTLINKQFMTMNSQYKHELVKVLQKRVEDGTLARNVVINLTDALTYCCPYMPLNERNFCLRLFVLKTPRTIETIEAKEKGLSREQLKKLKAMFEFFDKDGSGGIDKFEIVEVLEKLASNNNQNNISGDKLNDDDDKGANIEDAEYLIASVQGHDAEELNFESFIKMFRSLV